MVKYYYIRGGHPCGNNVHIFLEEMTILSISHLSLDANEIRTCDLHSVDFTNSQHATVH